MGRSLLDGLKNENIRSKFLHKYDFITLFSCRETHNHFLEILPVQLVKSLSPLGLQLHYGHCKGAFPFPDRQHSGPGSLHLLDVL